jgi:hypothetical protein
MEDSHLWVSFYVYNGCNYVTETIGMGRVIHFEVTADDLDRAEKFYK